MNDVRSGEGTPMMWEEGDRHRIFFAGLLTIAALPLLWATKNNDPAGPSVATVGAPSAAQGPASVPFEPENPAYLGDGGVTPTSAGPIQLDVAPLPNPAMQVGRAGYRRWTFIDPDDHACATPLAPFGTSIVVTNTDNGVKVKCTNVDTKQLQDPELVIVIDTDTFVDLADLTEAPIPVELSW